MKMIHNSYGFLFAKANQRIEQLLQPSLDEMGITSKQMGLIFIVQEHPGITQIKAAEIQQIDRTTMTQLVDSLERKEFIKRNRIPEDRRAYGLYLTEQGESIFTKLWAAINDVQAVYFQRISNDQMEQLKTILLLLINEEV